MEKTILGLDLGTNSIGWALIKQDFEVKSGIILGMGSRIIPMAQDIMGEFGKGNSISQTAERTSFRGTRRLRERFLLRRERLHRVLNLLEFLPTHYSSKIDFDKRLGKFIDHSEPKINYNNGFIFMDSYNEMLLDFQKLNAKILVDKDGKPCLIPHDWTIYYLRKKALSEKITKHELAWIILNFNQKRGYYQLRGEGEDETANKREEFYSLRITDVISDDVKNNKGEIWYSLHLENGWVYRRSSKNPLYDWKDKIKDFIVTTSLNEDGSEKIDKEGEIKRSFRAPGPDDWTLVKKKTEHEIDTSSLTVGEYIYNHLLLDPSIKIKGKLIRTIERKYYKSELELILNEQAKYHKEFTDADLLNDCIRELYRHNDGHQQQLKGRDLIHLFINDIIFYQRPLKSQKFGVGKCTLEFKTYKVRDKLGEFIKDDTGSFVEKKAFVPVVPKSNPYFQELRILQWLNNLEIYDRDSGDRITCELLRNITDYNKLFDFLNNRKEIRQADILKFLLTNHGFKGGDLRNRLTSLRWNYVEDKAYPCNETRALLSGLLSKVHEVPNGFLSFENEYALWHILYSVNDKLEFESALRKFAWKNNLNIDEFVKHFKKTPPLKSDYGSYSEKAIKKLLPLMRFGENWDWDQIDNDVKVRIGKLLSGEFDEKIKDRVREKSQNLTNENDFQMLPLWLAQYIVYNTHSEAKDFGKWETSEDLGHFLKEFKQHSLRNPIVEQVLTETLRVVRDIWEKFGHGQKDFFSEIHIELGRELKNPADVRSKLTNTITENENTNLRIKSLLIELAADQSINNVRPYSPIQLDILKIYEESALNAQSDIEEDILKISKTAQPSPADLKKYKLWLEQKYCSPYTGQPIPLSKLFTAEYEIEHIIPQSLYFDDSLGNKVICESAVNKLKDNKIGLAFIKAHQGQVVDCGFGKTVKIMETEEYIQFITNCYAKNQGKRNRLMLEEIPIKMIERQLNDTRYISKYIQGLLSNIVREEGVNANDDGVNSKNVIAGNGKITNKLKQDWGLNDVWNDLIIPRFERMNKLTDSSAFTSWNENHQKFLPTVPLEFSKGFSKKRIDHRHHAMDALIIACATRDHVNLLNNESAGSEKKRYDLNRKLRIYEKVTYKDLKSGSTISREVPKGFIKPWDKFTTDAKINLERIIVSFKSNLRVINKATNYYESYREENGELRLDKHGNPVKDKIAQLGTNWAIRKSLNKETVSGKVALQGVKVGNGKILTATRKSLDTSFNLKSISSITDTGIQKILLSFLKSKNNNPELAFSPEGIEELNSNIRLYNDGKDHKPIKKVRVFEQGTKFSLGESGAKTKKYVEAAKGTNLYFGIYKDETGKRFYETIPLNVVVERLKQGLTPVPELNDLGHFLLFTLSPNDLVYVREGNEESSLSSIDNNRIYKMEKTSGSACYFVRHDIAYLIKQYDPNTKIGELESQNKLQTTMCEDRIKIADNCVKLIVDRLGVINFT